MAKRPHCSPVAPVGTTTQLPDVRDAPVTEETAASDSFELPAAGEMVDVLKFEVQRSGKLAPVIEGLAMSDPPRSKLRQSGGNDV